MATSAWNDSAEVSLKKIVDNTASLSGGGGGTVNVVVTNLPDNPTGTPGTEAITVQGAGYTGTATVTRAGNTTPYNAGDVVGGALTIANVGPSGGEVMIDTIRLLCNITALPSGMGPFSLYFYNVTPPSAIADNSPFTMGSGDRASYVGQITGLTVAAIGTGTLTIGGELNGFLNQFKLASGSTSLFAYLVTGAGFTPAANSETYALTVKGIIP